MKQKKLISFLLAALLAVPTGLTFGSAAVETANVVSAEEISKTYLTEERTYNGIDDRYEVDSQDLSAFQDLGSGSISVKFKTSSSGLMALAALNGSGDTNDYISLYLNGGSTIGFEIRDYSESTTLDYIKTVVLSDQLNDNEWHAVTLVCEEGVCYKVYVDQKLAGTISDTNAGLSSRVSWEATSVTLGGAKRTGSGSNNYAYTGSLKEVKFYQKALTETEVLLDHQGITVKEDPTEYEEGVYKTQEDGIFDLGEFGSYNYRIPALTTTKDGVLIASADQRNTHWYDWGNIDNVIRTSNDGGLTWEPVQDIFDLRSQPYYSGTESSITMDPAIVSTNLGPNQNRTFIFVDMFPESTNGAQGAASCKVAGSGYVEVDGTKYLALYDDNGTEYTLRGNEVYDASGNKTNYTVDLGSYKDSFKTAGDLYEGDTFLGNIYLRSTRTGNLSAPLHPFQTSYLWLTYSDDNGKTWSNPIDLNSMIKEEWMRFCGVGPGVGIQLEHGEHKGRIIFPIYYTVGDGYLGFQSSACVYSDDGGVTWKRGESPNDGRTNKNGEITNSQNPTGVDELTESQIIELNNGHLLQFMRNTGSGKGQVAVARSTDGGETWEDPYYTPVTEVYCQLSVLHYPDLVDIDGDGVKDEILIMSNPGGSLRNNGKLRIAKVGSDDSLTWVREKMFCPGNYAYSCLSYIGDGKIGLLYEHANTIKFTSFNLDYILSDTNLLSPTISDVSMEIEKHTEQAGAIVGDQAIFTVTVDQPVTVTGNPTFRFRIGTDLKNTYAYAKFTGISEDGMVLTFTYDIEEEIYGAINYKGPKIISDKDNCVVNISGLAVSANDTEVDLGAFGPDYSSDARDIPVSNLTAFADSVYPGTGNEGPAEKVLDGNTETHWHTNYKKTEAQDVEKRWIGLRLSEESVVDGIRYLHRSGAGNGSVTEYKVQYRTEENGDWIDLTTGTLEKVTTWQMISFDPVVAKEIRVIGVKTSSADGDNMHMSVGELRLTGHLGTCGDEHSWGAWTVTKEASIGIEGAKERICSICHQKETKAIEALKAEFTDVKNESNFYYTPVYWAAGREVTSGKANGTFDPKGEVTRGEMVTFLWRLAGEPEAEGTHNFTDVQAGRFYEKAVLWAVSENIVKGTSETTFSPNDPVTRGQVATFLYRYADGTASQKAPSFTDVSKGRYYYEAVSWAAENNITKGSADGTYRPNDTCSRGEAVTFIYRTDQVK